MDDGVLADLLNKSGAFLTVNGEPMIRSGSLFMLGSSVFIRVCLRF